MPYQIDQTHDPKLESWVESANDPATDFPIQNLPYVAMEIHQDDGSYCDIGVAIGNCVLPMLPALVAAERQKFDFGADPWDLMNYFGDLKPEQHSLLRRAVSLVLRKDNSAKESLESTLLPISSSRFHFPVRLRDQPATVGATFCGDYTDFYASLHHATNVGCMFRPDNPILPNYKHIPIGYHGRASSIVPSGTPVRRPVGQQAQSEDGGSPGFGPCKMLDYELEMGAIIARGNALGQTISIEQAEDYLLGLCLVNDWSARDMQKWEYQPLGPFLAKNFATTVSPYIVTMEALAPFRCPAETRAPTDPQPLPYLFSEHNRSSGGFDITCEVYLASADMRKQGIAPIRLSTGNLKHMYWTLAQMLTHHASNGCNMQPGDLIASGTISGPERHNRGCLLELTWDGDKDNPVPGSQRTPIELPTGEKRVFLADGDEVILKAFCEREGFRRIGFGECRGIIEPARS